MPVEIIKIYNCSVPKPSSLTTCNSYWKFRHCCMEMPTQWLQLSFDYPENKLTISDECYATGKFALTYSLFIIYVLK